MSDPRSIMEGPPRDAFENSLVDAARLERMPDSSRARVLQALGVGPLVGPGPSTEPTSAVQASAAPAAPATAAAIKPAVWGWGKVLGLSGVVASAAALGGWLALASGEAERAEVNAPAQSGEHEVVAAPPERVGPAPAAAATVISYEELMREEAPTASPGTGKAAPASAEGEAAAGEGDASSKSSLAEELAAIRGARSTLSSGQARAALEQLDGYAVRFPEGRLRQEAAVLRIEALVALGDRAQAERLAQPLLEQNSTYAARLRSLLGG